MKLLICGSAAAEGVPGLFCTCPLCLKALSEGGKDVRSRTAYQLGDTIRIDCGPDMFYHMVKYRLRLDLLEDLVITHNHRDHFYPEDIDNRKRGMSKVPAESLLRITGSRTVIEDCKKFMEPEQNKVVFRIVEPGDKVMLSNGVELTVFKADHSAPDAQFFAFRNEKFSLLIANDTGWFPDESWDLIKKENFKFDAVVADCCFQHIDKGSGHMGGETFLRVFEELRKSGSLADGAVLVANHFSHNPGMSHEDMCKFFNPHGIEVGFDGMEIEL
ncbi:MAG: hypothetical protein IKA87_03730 [Lentisphaeria bacterium]|nr:hypothetical protein [Lentisphaeria bacterium]